MRSSLMIALAGAVLLAGVSGCATLSPTFKTELTTTLSDAKGKLSACYGEALTRNPKLAGTMAVKLTVAKKTTALTDVAVVERPGQDPALDKCVTDVIGRLEVPTAPKLTVNVEYPFTLAPQP